MLNLHIYPSTFKFESRMLKETKSIITLHPEYKIIIVSVHQPPLKKHEKIDERREVIRIPIFGNNESRNKIIKGINYLFFLFRVTSKFIFRKVHAINCHSLPVMPIGVIFKVLKGTKLIYDTHELETERESLSGLSKKIMQVLESICIRFADRVMVVNYSIGQWYKKRYSLKDIYVVRNVPYRVTLDQSYDLFREKFGISRESIIFLYQGFLNPGRAIDFLLDVFAKLDDTRHIVFMGYGSFEKEIEAYSQRHKNIHFHPAVPMHMLPSYTASADVGISLTDKPCLSYQLSLGNKFFEFINAEIPFIFWDGFIEVNQLNDRYQFGWKVPKDAEKVTKLVTGLTRQDINERKANVLKCKPDFDWTNEEKEIARAYEF